MAPDFRPSNIPRKIGTVRRLIANGGAGAVARPVLRRIGRVQVRIRKWLVRDRAWIGRLVAVTRQNIWIEGCRFDFGHPLITDPLRCRALFGRYERSERQLLHHYLEPALPVVELGGGLGVIACLTNRLLDNPMQHVVVEANPALIPVLAQHREWNACDFALIAAAIDYQGAPQTTLEVETDFLSARAGGSQGVQVPATTLRKVLERFPFRRCTLICDIEGAETTLVREEARLLAERVACFIVEMHPEFCAEHERDAMLARLKEYGFLEVARVRKVRAFTNVRHL